MAFWSPHHVVPHHVVVLSRDLLLTSLPRCACNKPSACKCHICPIQPPCTYLPVRVPASAMQGFFSDFLAKVQNSIATELLPAAAAQAAAAEQLLGDSPAAAAAALNRHLPQPPPLLLTPSARGAAGGSAASAGGSPFAAVDAEVFVTTPLQVRRGDCEGFSAGEGVGVSLWLMVWSRYRKGFRAGYRVAASFRLLMQRCLSAHHCR